MFWFVVTNLENLIIFRILRKRRGQRLFGDSQKIHPISLGRVSLALSLFTEYVDLCPLQGAKGEDCDLLFPCSSLPQHYRLVKLNKLHGQM